jgi:hypothetical protein
VAFDAALGTVRSSHVASCPDVAPECATTQIPDHEHRAAVDLSHFELTANYGLRENLQLSLRLPYDQKAMAIRYTTLDGAPFTPPYGDIHHRTRRLTGLGDPSLVLDYAPHPHWVVGVGTTFTLGRIERNPIELGRQGLEHEHMQFGTGTFQPKLAVQFSRPHFVARTEATLSLYENREGFRAPHIFLWSLGPSFNAGAFTIDPRLAGQYQSLGRWNGEVDEGTGFSNGGARLQVSVPWRGYVIAPGVYRELWSKSLHHEESFAQEWTWSVMVARTF